MADNAIVITKTSFNRISKEFFTDDEKAYNTHWGIKPINTIHDTTTIYAVLHDAIIRCHLIYIQLGLFLRSWLLHCYYNNDVPNITWDTIYQAHSVLTIKVGDTSISGKNKTIYDTLTNLLRHRI